MASRFTPEKLEKEVNNLQIQLDFAADETPPEDCHSNDDEDISEAPPLECSEVLDLPSSGSVYNPSQSSAISDDSELLGGINIIPFSKVFIKTMFRDSQF